VHKHIHYTAIKIGLIQSLLLWINL